ncbi:copine-3-like [Corticium candelabrum]|uniref:copine-3-like n=1 Tax=Corticium candelabrum TaxID=121492 RepID=UPI002E2669E3|nr:copine-3-like [Corticium candelabrum]
MATSMCVSHLYLRLSCTDLRDADITSKSDPVVVVTQYDRFEDKYTEVGRTEIVRNTLNPSFVKPVRINYHFEEVQKVLFRVYDADDGEIDELSTLGSAETTLGTIVGSIVTTLPLVQNDNKKRGTITIVAEETSEIQEEYYFTFTGRNLDKKDFLGKSDPYLLFECPLPNGEYRTTYKTKHIVNTLDPDWSEICLSFENLCGAREDQEIRVSCYDYDDDSADDLIGMFTTTWKEMMKARRGLKISWECISPKKKMKKKNYINSGRIFLRKLRVEKIHSFMDYLYGGCQIHFTVGIDFTGSNGDPREPSSLHFIDPSKPNDYMRALVAVGNVCEQYDSDKLIPAFGFGAKVPPNNEVSHEFPVNFNSTNPYCSGIAGVAAAYQTAIQTVTLWGPTNVAPIINHVAKFAKDAGQSEMANHYYVLLLITDGEISDMDETIQAIIEASYFPMSIIIVGVGSANFSNMKDLDRGGSYGMLYSSESSKRFAERDIVQFVPFSHPDRQFASAEDLAKEVLAEIPDQVVGYYRGKKLRPMRRVATQPPV